MSRNKLASNINHETFNKWTYKNAWALGLVTADGSSGNKHKPRQFVLYSTELEILEAVKDVFESDKKVFVNQGVKGRLGKKPVGTLAISSPVISDFLKSINAWGNKDERNPFPYVPDEYKWSFIKGVFDGDGNVYKGHFAIAGREHMIQEIYDWICKQIDKGPNKLYKSTGTNKTVYFQMAKSDSERVYHLMEKHSEGTYNSEKYKKLQAFYEVGDGMELF